MVKHMQRDILVGYQHPCHHEINGEGFLDFLKPIGNILKPLIGPVLSAIPGIMGDVEKNKVKPGPSFNDQLMQLYNSTEDPKMKLEILKQMNKS